MRRLPAGDDFDGWIGQLAIAHRRQHAKQVLQLAGRPAVPAIRRGLSHPNAMVRRLCTSLLDRLADYESLTDLVTALDDPDSDVRRRALHALACEACKRLPFSSAELLRVTPGYRSISTQSSA